MKLSTFAKYAWFTLVYNVIVIIWGVFLRASKSGDGCGQHWLTCKGEVIPSAPQLKTTIEFIHRVMSGIDVLVMIGLVVLAFVYFPKHDRVRKFSVISFVFMVSEALLGAGLVLTGNTAVANTSARPFWAIGHLINTFILLACITITAYLATYDRKFNFKIDKKATSFFILGALGILLVGSSGVIAALASMLFPSESLLGGIRADFAPESNVIIKLRIIHPIASVLIAIGLIYFGSWLRRRRTSSLLLQKFAFRFSALVAIQILFGIVTLVMLAPILLQLGHLLIADLIWIYFILAAATFFSERPNHLVALPVFSEREY